MNNFFPRIHAHCTQGPSATWLAFSPDSATIAASCCDGTVRLTDTATGDCKAIIEAHPAGWQLHHVTWAPDGTTLAVAAADRSVRLYDVRSQVRLGLSFNLFPVYSCEVLILVCVNCALKLA